MEQCTLDVWLSTRLLDFKVVALGTMADKARTLFKASQRDNEVRGYIVVFKPQGELLQSDWVQAPIVMTVTQSGVARISR